MTTIFEVSFKGYLWRSPQHAQQIDVMSLWHGINFAGILQTSRKWIGHKNDITPPVAMILSLLNPPPWLLKLTCDVNSPKSHSSRTLVKLEYTSSKFSGQDWYDLLFRGYYKASSSWFPGIWDIKSSCENGCCRCWRIPQLHSHIINISHWEGDQTSQHCTFTFMCLHRHIPYKITPTPHTPVLKWM